MDNIKSYIQIGRPDHWLKNIFIFPGIIFAILFSSHVPRNFTSNLILGIISLCLLSSANYVINEWLDRDFDKYHPNKKFRPSVTGKLKSKWIYTEYYLLIAIGLFFAYLISIHFFFFSLLLIIMGVLYNVSPIRTKDRLYLDVLSESLNNPIRFMLGWLIVENSYLPPSSILLAYWMGGAFLMGIKRFSEYRFINESEKAGLYRKSFKYYTEDSLLISSCFYALCSAFFLGVFLVKYRIEYLLCFPFFSLLFAWYLKIGLSANSAAQHPEKLYLEKPFMAYVIFLVMLFLFLSFVNIPTLHIFLNKALIAFKL